MLRTVGWALYLAVSWTWCIGMYLPSLLYRDQGKPGFWAFFIPNVLGAMSVGWLISNREKSERFVKLCRPVMLAFTAVTISFHGYWLTWMFGGVYTAPLILAGAAGGALGVLSISAIVRRVGAAAAAFTLLCSLLLGVCLVGYPPPAVAGSVDADLLGLAAVCVLGFGLCPYLDLTFQRASQESPSPRAAFTVGFLVFFALTILVATRGRAVWSEVAPIVVLPDWVFFPAIGLHFGAQATFTIAAHTAALRSTGGIPRLRSRPALPLTLVAGLAGIPLAVVALLWPSVPADTLDGMNLPEVGYRLYLGAYGLVFPVWMIIALKRRRAADRTALIWLAAACCVAGPFFLIGSLWRQEAWYIPGVILAVVVPLLVPRVNQPESDPSR